MHGEHAHLVTALLEIALHLAGMAGEPVEEALQAWRGFALEVQRGGEEFVDRLVGLCAKTGDEMPPSAAGTEQFGIKGKGCNQIGARQQMTQLCNGRLPVRLLVEIGSAHV